MRSRIRAGRTLSAEQLVRVAESLPGFGAVGGTAMSDQWEAGLRDRGYDPVAYFRARYWLRRGRPAGYRWDW